MENDEKTRLNEDTPSSADTPSNAGTSNINDLNQFFEEFGQTNADGNPIDEKTAQKISEIKQSIDEHTEQRAQIVQEMLKEKEKTPSLIKSIVERITGE